MQSRTKVPHLLYHVAVIQLDYSYRDNPAELAHDHVAEIQLDLFLHVVEIHTLSFTLHDGVTGDQADLANLCHPK